MTITVEMHRVRGGAVVLRPLAVNLANNILTITEWRARQMVSTGFYM